MVDSVVLLRLREIELHIRCGRLQSALRGLDFLQDRISREQELKGKEIILKPSVVREAMVDAYEQGNAGHGQKEFNLFLAKFFAQTTPKKTSKVGGDSL